MSLRKGVTVMEENAIKKAIKDGTPWFAPGKDAYCIVNMLQDVDLDYVKTNIYEPLVRAAEADELTAAATNPPAAKA